MTDSSLRRSRRLANRTFLRNIYETLDTSAKDFVATRIITILPKLSPQGNIQCTLMPLSVCLQDNRPPISTCSECGTTCEDPNAEVDRHNDTQQYIALSYMWGPIIRTKTIEVNGLQHQVRPNLWDFLDHARKKYPNVRIWIDALCIDQSNFAERNYQVKFMGYIYMQASQVMIWLGCHLEKLDHFFDVAVGYSQKMSNADCVGMHPDIFELVCQQYNWTAADWKEALRELLRLEYWTRAWVGQEFTLARELLILSGSRTVNYEALESAIFASVRDAEREEDGHGRRELIIHALGRFLGGRVLATRGGIIEPRMHDGSISCSRVFEGTANYQCGNVKDRIYSQLSLIGGGDRFHVDYSEDEYTLLLRTLIFCHEEEGKNYESRTVKDGKCYKHKNSRVGEHVYPNFRRIASILGLSGVAIREELAQRARTSELFQSFLLRFSTAIVPFKPSVHPWPTTECLVLDCPDCGECVLSISRPMKFTHFCCLKPWTKFECHISFAQSPSDDNHASFHRTLMFHFDAILGICEQETPVYSSSGLCLSMSTYLSLVEQFNFSLGAEKQSEALIDSCVRFGLSPNESVYVADRLAGLFR